MQALEDLKDARAVLGVKTNAVIAHGQHPLAIAILCGLIVQLPLVLVVLPARE
jgi:multidrug efflux pump subunit AcrB